MYGILISFGILTASLIAEKEVKKQNLNTEIFWEGLLVAIFAGLIGARSYHVAENWSYYTVNKNLIPQIWQGGAHIVGGIMLAVISLVVYLKNKQENILTWLDIGATVLPLGQFIGRWGNYFNKELLPYAFYEMILDLALFICLIVLQKYPSYQNKYKKGTLFSIYLIGYAGIRFVLEPTRPYQWHIGRYNVTQTIAVTTIIVILSIYGISCIRSWRLQTKK